MKRLLGTVLALAIIMPPGASAEILKNLKVSGQLDVQMTSARNVTDFATRPANHPAADGGDNNDRVGTTLTRTMLNLDWDLLDDVHAQGTLVKNDRVWGTAAPAAGGQAAATGEGQGLIGAPGATDVAGNLVVQRASIMIDKLLGHFDTTVGRQYYGTPGDLVIYFGPKDVHGLFVTAIDAARFEAECDMMSFSGMAGTTASGAAATGLAGAANASNNNTQVRGFDIMWKNLPVRAHTFVWNQVTQAAGGLGVAPVNAAGGATGMNDFLYVYGVKLRGEAMGGWFNLDLAKNSGQDRTTLAGAADGFSAASGNYIGTAMLLDVGYNAEIANVGGFTPWANFGWGSGRSSNGEESNENFTAIAPDYRPGVINRRFNGAGAINLGANAPGGGVGTVGLGNRVVWGLGLNYTPAKWDRMTAGVSLWDYRFQRNTITGPGATLLAAGNKHIGSEFGLTAEWRHSENVTLGAGWASFQPGGLVYERKRAAVPGVQEGVNPAQMVFADLTVKF